MPADDAEIITVLQGLRNSLLLVSRSTPPFAEPEALVVRMAQVDDVDRINIEAEELVPFLDFLSLP